MKKQHLKLTAIAPLVLLSMATKVCAAPAGSASARSNSVRSNSAQSVDPAAWRVVQRAVAAYAKLESYSGTMETHTIVPPGINFGGSPQRAIISYKRPNKNAVLIQDEQGAWNSVSDGRNIITTTPLNTRRYLKTPVRPNQRNFTGAFGYDNQLMTCGSGFFAVLATSDNEQILRASLLSMPFGPEEKLEIRATLDAAKSINGEPVNTVVIASRRFSRRSGEAKGKWRASRNLFSFAKSDGLLRRIRMEFEFLAGEKPIVTIETHSVTSLNAPLPDAMFRAPTPAGAATPVASGEQLLPEREPMFGPRLKAGAKPFAFSATDLKGRTFSLESYRGRVVLLDFWATWCGPCIGELPEMRVVYDKYHARGFEIVSVSLDDDRSALMAFLAKEKLVWPQVFDGKGWNSPLAKQYGVRAIPATFLIGRDGKIASVDLRGLALEPAVQEALQQKLPVGAP